jgi:hypothetical protein
VDEALIVAYYHFLLVRNRVFATILSMTVSALNYLVIGTVVLDRQYALLLSFIIGIGLGTALTMTICNKE